MQNPSSNRVIDPAANSAALVSPPLWMTLDECRMQAPVALLPWLAELGGSALGEVLARIGEVVREPLEYLALPRGHGLDVAARAGVGGEAVADTRRCWARRAGYRLGQHRILVTEVFLPALEDRG